MHLHELRIQSSIAFSIAPQPCSWVSRKRERRCSVSSPLSCFGLLSSEFRRHAVQSEPSPSVPRPEYAVLAGPCHSEHIHVWKHCPYGQSTVYLPSPGTTLGRCCNLIMSVTLSWVVMYIPRGLRRRPSTCLQWAVPVAPYSVIRAYICTHIYMYAHTHTRINRPLDMDVHPYGTSVYDTLVVLSPSRFLDWQLRR
jgi:hypothetical protein